VLANIHSVEVGGFGGGRIEIGENDQLAAVWPGIGELIVKRTGIEGDPVGGISFNDVDSVGIGDEKVGGVGVPLEAVDIDGRVVNFEVLGSSGKVVISLEMIVGGDGQGAGGRSG